MAANLFTFNFDDFELSGYGSSFVTLKKFEVAQ